MFSKHMAMALVLAAGMAQAAVYRWVDAGGGVHYSDQRPAGGEVEEVDLPEFTRYAPPPKPADGAEPGDGKPRAPSPRTGPGATVPSPKPAGAPTGAYQQLVVLSPQDGSTVRSNSGTVAVRIESTPSLRAGDTITYLLDDVPTVQRSRSTIAVLANVERGEHGLQVLIRARTGNVVVASNRSTFFVRKTTLNDPIPKKKREAAEKAAAEKAAREAAGAHPDGGIQGTPVPTGPTTSGPAAPTGSNPAFAPRYSN